MSDALTYVCIGAALVVIGVLVAVAMVGRAQADGVYSVTSPTPVDGALDILLVPDAADYGPSSNRDFLVDAQLLVGGTNGRSTGIALPPPGQSPMPGLYRNNVFASNPNRFNFWYTRQSVNVSVASGACPVPDLSPIRSTLWDFDVVMVLHARNYHDCTIGDVATAEVDEVGTVLHELGHALFDLPDEWPGGHLEEALPSMILADTTETCEDKLAAWMATPPHRHFQASCHWLTKSARLGSSVYRTESVPDAMSLFGSLLTHYGRADWEHIRVDMLRRLPSPVLRDPDTWPP